MDLETWGWILKLTLKLGADLEVDLDMHAAGADLEADLATWGRS